MGGKSFTLNAESPNFIPEMRHTKDNIKMIQRAELASPHKEEGVESQIIKGVKNLFCY